MKATLELLEIEEEHIETITEIGKGRKRKLAKKYSPMVDTQVRRSPRLKESSLGSKSSVCFSKKGLCYTPGPPILSPNLIKKLGTDFCKMDEDLLSEEALRSKKRQQAPVAEKHRDVDAAEEETGSSQNSHEENLLIIYWLFSWLC